MGEKRVGREAGMSVKILNVLCEGQTEELFVKRVLRDYMAGKSVVTKTRLLLTNGKRDVRGGIKSYGQVRRDLGLWHKENLGKRNETHFYTTMIDFYALPSDFPGYAEAMKVMDVNLRVEKLEETFGWDVNMQDFIPYVQLHEYEALVFCGLDFLLERYAGADRAVKELRKVLNGFSGNPEFVDGGWDTAPGRRIASELAKVNYRYNKPESGAYVAERVGMTALRERCGHFDGWIRRLDKIAK